MRRDARRSEGRGSAGGGRVTLRSAVAVALVLVCAWLAAAGLFGAAPTATVAAFSPPTADSPTPAPTPCLPPLLPDCSTPTPRPTFTAPPTATPVPTPTPTPVPATAAATQRPTPYAEQINPQQTLPTIAPISVNSGITPHPTGSGSPLAEYALLGIVVFAVIAGTSFFLFFRVR